MCCFGYFPPHRQTVSQDTWRHTSLKQSTTILQYCVWANVHSVRSCMLTMYSQYTGSTACEYCVNPDLKAPSPFSCVTSFLSLCILIPRRCVWFVQRRRSRPCCHIPGEILNCAILSKYLSFLSCFVVISSFVWYQKTECKIIIALCYLHWWRDVSGLLMMCSNMR